MRSIATLLQCRRAATAVEYGLILALVVIALIVGLKALGNQTASTWSNVNNAVQNAG